MKAIDWNLNDLYCHSTEGCVKTVFGTAKLN